jgi:hypothetical protein
MMRGTDSHGATFAARALAALALALLCGLGSRAVAQDSSAEKEMTDVLPQITREALDVGVGIGRQVGTRVIETLLAEGTLPAAGAPPPPPKPQPQNNTGGRPERRRN